MPLLHKRTLPIRAGRGKKPPEAATTSKYNDAPGGGGSIAVGGAVTIAFIAAVRGLLRRGVVLGDLQL